MSEEKDDSEVKIEEQIRAHKEQGKVIWFFGRPCSGKTTLADRLAKDFDSLGISYQRLDGDIVRKKFTRDLGFSIEDRFENIRRMGYLAEALTEQGINVIASFVTPLRAYRLFLEKILRNRLILIECKASLDECIRRDVKGMYEKALLGEIKQFTGLTSPYEEGVGFNVLTEKFSEVECMDWIEEYLQEVEF
jgi:adenylyl-sulfate kinase